jgi:hypothetical protein
MKKLKKTPAKTTKKTTKAQKKKKKWKSTAATQNQQTKQANKSSKTSSDKHTFAAKPRQEHNKIKKKKHDHAARINVRLKRVDLIKIDVQALSAKPYLAAARR